MALARKCPRVVNDAGDNSEQVLEYMLSRDSFRQKAGSKEVRDFSLSEGTVEKLAKHAIFAGSEGASSCGRTCAGSLNAGIEGI